MIKINNKSWNDLVSADIKDHLSEDDGETFFFEYKSDDESPKKLIKEVSAFANTYGGYIFLGVADDKTIEGCKKWDEQRIHITIHEQITPTPIFDVKTFDCEGKIVYIIKIEEGNMPPYITNKGQIYERVSSGSFPIINSNDLIHLYNKRKDQIERIKNLIEPQAIGESGFFPQNVCGCYDLGFYMVLSEPSKFQDMFNSYDFSGISELIRKSGNNFSISQLATSCVISVGSLSAKNGAGKVMPLKAGINNFIEIFYNGSIRSRIMLISNEDAYADISPILIIKNIYKSIYSFIFKDDLQSKFISAQKYIKLTVFQQFTPMYIPSDGWSPKEIESINKHFESHKEKYGNNLMVESSRCPENGYFTLDRSTITSSHNGDYANDIIEALFENYYYDLGYIDPLVID